MGDMTSWLYDPLGRLKICIVGQLAILMLIEELELNGIECFSSNTDGASFIVHKNKKELFKKICKAWELHTKYELEELYYEKIYFQNINSYIGRLTDGTIKKKGIFLTSTELHKNKSFRIIPLALEQYFMYNKPVEEFINSHNNIFDFLSRSVGNKTYYHKDITQNIKLPNIIRYYPCNKEGSVIMKMVRENNDTNAKNTNIEPADYKKIICNYLPKEDYEKHLKNVNREFFINECYKIIRPIELGRKIKEINTNKNQLSLW